MGVAVVLVVLIAGSLLFHFLSPWYFTPIASNWTAVDTVCFDCGRPNPRDSPAGG